jgi:hypothetical protein
MGEPQSATFYDNRYRESQQQQWPAESPTFYDDQVGCRENIHYNLIADC